MTWLFPRRISFMLEHQIHDIWHEPVSAMMKIIVWWILGYESHSNLIETICVLFEKTIFYV
jgi:hypothetical protein